MTVQAKTVSDIRLWHKNQEKKRQKLSFKDPPLPLAAFLVLEPPAKTQQVINVTCTGSRNLL